MGVMTPTQLKTFAAVVRHGSSKSAAEELGVSEAAVSNHISALRRELDDRLFHRSHDGLVFTPGGLRLATRSVEMLGLQEQTKAEVHAAADGQRLLRLAVSSLFAEYCAPGLIELFTTRAKDLRVEVSVHSPDRFGDLIANRVADLAMGPSIPALKRDARSIEFVRYQQVAAVSRSHPLAGKKLSAVQATQLQWLLGPSAIDPGGVAHETLQQLAIPEDQQLVFQSSEAALAEARSGGGVAFALLHRVSKDIKAGKLATVTLPCSASHGTWTVYSGLPHQITPAASELLRFVQTPRAVQATLAGSAAHLNRFKPSVHVTLWS